AGAPRPSRPARGDRRHRRVCRADRNSFQWFASITGIVSLVLSFECDKILLDHLPHELGKPNLVAPSQAFPRLRWITCEPVDLGRAKIARIDADENLARPCIDTLFFDAAAEPRDPPADMGERKLDELADGTGFTGGEYVIARLVLLQD